MSLGKCKWFLGTNSFGHFLLKFLSTACLNPETHQSGTQLGQRMAVSEARMFWAVETLRNEMEMSCWRWWDGGGRRSGISEYRDRKWEEKSHKEGEKGFGRVGGRIAPTKATPFAVLTTMVHTLRPQCVHIENTYRKHCNSSHPIGFLFLQLSLQIQPE